MRLALIGTPRSLGPVRPELGALLPEDVERVAFPSRVGVFPSDPAARDMQALGHFEAGLTAVEGGADALVLDTLGDYGLAALRAGAGVPVVGAGEAGMARAAALGRFAIVTVWPASMNFIPRDLLHLYGHVEACTGIYNVGEEADLADLSGPDGYLGRIGEGTGDILARVRSTMARAVMDGAEAILLGCTCMSPIAARLAEGALVPVINPLAEAARQAVDAARDGTPCPAQTARLPAVRAMVDALADLPEEACPVCVLSEGL